MDWGHIAGAAVATALLATQGVHLDRAHRLASLEIGILGVEVLAVRDIPQSSACDCPRRVSPQH
jgi:hypothetical protein